MLSCHNFFNSSISSKDIEDPEYLVANKAASKAFFPYIFKIPFLYATYTNSEDLINLKLEKSERLLVNLAFVCSLSDINFSRFSGFSARILVVLSSIAIIFSIFLFFNSSLRAKQDTSA